jgi:CRP/FNR family transcriptional regulator, cyclic AMP receptor protein
MTHPSLQGRLGEIDLFSGVPDGVLSDLVDAGSTHTTPAGATVVAQGGSDAGLQIVLEGSVDVEVNGVRRPEILPGGYFGEISVIDGGGRSATLTAGKDGLTTFAISPLSFSPLIDKHPELARSLLKALCARLRAVEGAASLA